MLDSDCWINTGQTLSSFQLLSTKLLNYIAKTLCRNTNYVPGVQSYDTQIQHRVCIE